MKFRFLKILMISLISFLLYSCTDYLFKNDEFIIYENEDKSIVIEIDHNKGKNSAGKLYIKEDDQILIFLCDFPIATHQSYLIIYSNIIFDENNYDNKAESYLLLITYEKTENGHFFKNRDDLNFMTLTDDNEPSNNVTFKRFFNINMKFKRVHDREIKTLSFFENKWKSFENKIVFFNDHRYLYGKNIIKGRIKDEEVLIKFSNVKTFEITNENQEIILAGNYDEEERNIILRKNEIFDQYPDEIILKFERLK